MATTETAFPDHPRDLPDGECHAPAGYCAGLLTTGGRWLTVLGSAYDYVPLFAVPDRAAAWAHHKGWHRAHGFTAGHVIRWVRRTDGGHFEVDTPPADRFATPAYLATVEEYGRQVARGEHL